MGDRVAMRHRTLAAPKSDRIRLLSTLGANTSPILSMYRDSSGEIAEILEKCAAGKPIASAPLRDGERHELYSVNATGELRRLAEIFAAEPLYIADGHHRYESALTYQREKRALHPDAPAGTPFNFVLMTLVDMDDPGLLVLPPHRAGSAGTCVAGNGKG